MRQCMPSTRFPASFTVPWNHSFPERTAYTGTMDWTHCQFTYTTRPGTNGKKRAYIRLVLSAGCTGTAWFDGVRIVEMADSAQ